MTATTTPRRVLRDPSPDAQRRARPPRQSPKTPALEVVQPANPRGRRRALRRRVVIVFGILLVLATPFALVLVRVALTADQNRLTTLQTKGDQAQETYEKLRLQVDALNSPARIVATAEQLGMVTPTTITYLTAPAGSPPVTAVPPAGPGVSGWTSAKRVDRGR